MTLTSPPILSIGKKSGNLKINIRAFTQIIRWDRPIGTWLLLWPALMALCLAGNGEPDLRLVTIFIMGTYLMRAAGCIMNDWADRHFDGAVERTRQRPLVTGALTSRQAWGFMLLLLSLAFALVLQTNTLTIMLAFIGAGLAAIYPFMKRFIQAPQVVLGWAFAWSIPMAFAAHTQHIPPVAWTLFITTNCWIVAYDTIYAMVDREDDQKIGLRSTAIWFGHHDVSIVTMLLIGTWVGWWAVGLLMELHPLYYAGLLLAAGQIGYQVWHIRHREREACFKMFLANHQLGAIVFLSMLLGSLL